MFEVRSIFLKQSYMLCWSNTRYTHDSAQLILLSGDLCTTEAAEERKGGARSECSVVYVVAGTRTYTQGRSTVPAGSMCVSVSHHTVDNGINDKKNCTAYSMDS